MYLRWYSQRPSYEFPNKSEEGGDVKTHPRPYTPINISTRKNKLGWDFHAWNHISPEPSNCRTLASTLCWGGLEKGWGQYSVFKWLGEGRGAVLGEVAWSSGGCKYLLWGVNGFLYNYVESWNVNFCLHSLQLHQGKQGSGSFFLSNFSSSWIRNNI